VRLQAPDFSHAGKEAYIITRTPRLDQGQTRFYTGDLKTLVARLKAKDGKNIFVDGVAQIVQSLMAQRLVNEFVISIIPVCLGSGIALFADGLTQAQLQLQSVQQFDKGLVQLHYVLIREPETEA